MNLYGERVLDVVLHLSAHSLESFKIHSERLLVAKSIFTHERESDIHRIIILLMLILIESMVKGSPA